MLNKAKLLHGVSVTRSFICLIITYFFENSKGLGNRLCLCKPSPKYNMVFYEYIANFNLTWLKASLGEEL